MSDLAELAVPQTRRLTPREPYAVAALALGAFLLFLIFVSRGLGLDVMQSDAISYWRESRDWRTPFSVWWVPGYPLTLALLNGLTQGARDPREVMLAASAGWYAAGVLLTWSLARSWGLDAGAARSAAALFASYPFVGLTYAVYPVADGMAIALVLLMALGIARRRPALFAAAAAACLLTHKATWFFVAGLVVAAWRQHPAWRRWCVIPFLPFAGYLAVGAWHYGDPLWMVRWSGEHLFAPHGGLPLVDSTLGLLLTGAPAKMAKGAVVAAVLLLSVLVALACRRRRLPAGIALALALLIMGLTLNQYEAWAAVRFSKVLVVPAIACVAWSGVKADSRFTGAAVAAIAAIGLGTNALYGAYMAWYFSSTGR
jgi:hypothetical protein